jgi:hypothetical protein
MNSVPYKTRDYFPPYAGHMWLQTSSEAIASVRLLGRSTMAWQDVRYQIVEATTDTSVAETIISVGRLTTGEKRRSRCSLLILLRSGVTDVPVC